MFAFELPVFNDPKYHQCSKLNKTMWTKPQLWQYLLAYLIRILRRNKIIFFTTATPTPKMGFLRKMYSRINVRFEFLQKDWKECEGIIYVKIYQCGWICRNSLFKRLNSNLSRKGGGNFRLNRVCESLNWFLNLRHVKFKIYFVLLRNVLLTIYQKKRFLNWSTKLFNDFYQFNNDKTY